MADESFIPPGQEALVGAMLGSGAALPGDCKLVSGNLEKTTIKATYTCPGGEVVVLKRRARTGGAVKEAAVGTWARARV